LPVVCRNFLLDPFSDYATFDVASFQLG
jgi:hypothetical protein